MPEDNSFKPQYTGRRLVRLDRTTTVKTIAAEAERVSLRLAFSTEYKNHEEDYVNAFTEADGIVFERFGVAVINDHHEAEVSELTKAPQSRRVFLYDEPERYIYSLQAKPLALMGRTLWEYICSIFGGRGRRPAPDPGTISPLPLPDQFSDNADAYWGIQAVRLLGSPYTGKGVKVAILDTGMNIAHPDFTERYIASKSFITNESVDDLNGHGSHCVGIAAGSSRGDSGIRYGVAKDASIYAGKVLSNAGSGSDSGILAGMEWAMENGCKVISMSLGASIRAGQGYSRIYDDVAKNALDQGVLIIAAAGNDSRRSQGLVQPINHPANCPNIMSVAAMDRFLEVADFSCGSVNKEMGQLVDIAAPGVSIFSAYKDPQHYASLSGTSMATPFVAGIAALLWEQFPSASAKEIWEMLKEQARPVMLSPDDVGSGLVQAQVKK